MSRISRDDVEHVAALARLSLSPEELGRMVGELDQVLEYVELLREVDTEGVEPTSHVIPLATPIRADRAEPPMDPEAVVANAPEHTDTGFLVPKVIDSEAEG